MIFGGDASKARVDVKWRSAIERALGSWESVVEWADYISFLARVQKAVKSGAAHASTTNMPLSDQVAEMLARCLDPALPSGVHKTALDVYDTVLKILSDDQLSHELNLWLPGLLPVVSFAAFNIKPVVLRVLEVHIVRRLDQDALAELVRPVLLACFPSLEDGDSFTEIVDLIQVLKDRTKNDPLFWQSLLLCTMTAPETRLGALAYCQKMLPSFSGPIDEIKSSAVITPDPGLLLRAVCAGLSDANVLVQRGWLDILVQKLPLSSAIFTEMAAEGDVTLVIAAAVHTILKRDMSLNRRLWVWLLGPDPDPESSFEGFPRLDYLRKYAYTPLISVLLDMLDREPENCLAVGHGLMDRWELGSQVAPALLEPVLRKCRENPGLVSQGASTFFDSIESNMVWKTALEVLKGGDTSTVSFMADHLDISDADMESLYIPYTMLWIMLGDVTPDEKELLFTLAKSMSPLSPPAKPYTQAAITKQKIERWFDASVESNIEGTAPKPPLDSGVLAYMLLDRSLDDGLLEIFLSRVPPGSLGGPTLQPLITQWAERLTVHANPALLIVLQPFMGPNRIASAVRAITHKAYEDLRTLGVGQVERVRELWNMHDAIGGHVVESAIAACMASSASPEESSRVYAALWAHSIERSDFTALLTKPTLLFLDDYPSNITSRLALDATVVRTGTAPKLVQLLADRLNSSINGDVALLAYDLDTVLRVIRTSDECRYAFLQRHFATVAELLLEWFAEPNRASTEAYMKALELIKLACLDTRTVDANTWLTTFTDALVASQLETKSRNVPLVLFIADILPHLSDPSSLGGFVVSCIAPLETDWDCVGYAQLLDALLNSSQKCDFETLVLKLLERLDILEESVISQELNNVGDVTAIAQLLGCVERCVSAAIVAAGTAEQEDREKQPREMLGQVISGVFSGIESPTDRSTMEHAKQTLKNVSELAVDRCCRYWKFVEHVRTSKTLTGAAGSALYAQGRLKTRLRRLLGLVYGSLPLETLGWISNRLPCESAVRLTHVFEASSGKDVLRVLVQDGQNRSEDMSDSKRFAFAVGYIQSLELDELEDAWPLIYAALGQVASASVGSVSANNGDGSHPIDQALDFVAQDLGGKLEKARLAQRRKARKEFTDVCQRLITTGLSLAASPVIKDKVWIEVTEKLSELVHDSDKQATLYGKILSQVAFPRLVNSGNVSVLQAVVQTAPTRVWKTTVGDYFFDSKKVFGLKVEQADALAPIIQSWIVADRDRITEFLAKVATYGSNSVLFGWSGSQELAADNLDRLAYLFMCGGQNLPVHWSKLLNQLTALWDSGTTVMGQICLVLRAVMLTAPSDSATEFMAFRIQHVLGEALRKEPSIDENQLLEVSKLLDLAVAVETQDFQLLQWLFVSDSTDAIYSGGAQQGCGRIVDKLARAQLPLSLSSSSDLVVPPKGSRRPLLPRRAGPGYLHAFFNSLSITLYEEKYSLGVLDEAYCRAWVLADIFK